MSLYVLSVADLLLSKYHLPLIPNPHMLFNSFEFLIFFPVVTVLFFVLPHRFRWLMLLLASCFFYMFFKWEYILILLGTIVVDYYAGLLIEGAGEPGAAAAVSDHEPGGQHRGAGGVQVLQLHQRQHHRHRLAAGACTTRFLT